MMCARLMPNPRDKPASLSMYPEGLDGDDDDDDDGMGGEDGGVDGGRKLFWLKATGSADALARVGGLPSTPTLTPTRATDEDVEVGTAVDVEVEIAADVVEVVDGVDCERRRREIERAWVIGRVSDV